MRNTWNRLNDLHRDGKSTGGFEIVDDWDAGSIIREVAEKDPEDLDFFNSRKEMIQFALGKGDYSDERGFTYGPEDLGDFQAEGYFMDPYCPHCVEEATDADIEDDIEPVIEPEVVTYSGKSYRLDAQSKEVTELWYQCEEHPEFYIKKTDKEHF